MVRLLVCNLFYEEEWKLGKINHFDEVDKIKWIKSIRLSSLFLKLSKIYV
jgi:hypothetical protein